MKPGKMPENDSVQKPMSRIFSPGFMASCLAAAARFKLDRFASARILLLCPAAMNRARATSFTPMRRSAKPTVSDPDVPYVANRDKPLTAYVFNAADVTDRVIDRLVGEFLAAIQPEIPKFTRPMEIWRGEILNAGGHFRCLAISNPGRRKVYDALLEVAGSHSCEAVQRTAVELALQPRLLVTAGKTWQFDANQPAGTASRVKFGKITLEVHALPYVWKKTPAPRPAATLDERYAALVDELSAWRGHLTNSAVHNWGFLNEAYPALLDTSRGQFDYALLKRICERAMCVHIVELPMPELGRIAVTPVWESAEGGLSNTGFGIRIAIDRRAEKRTQLAALAHELGHYIFHLPHHVFFARLPFAVMQNPDVEGAVVAKLGGVQAEYYRTTEVQADFFASAFIVPEGYGAWLNRSFITGRDTDAEAIETNLLHRTLGDHGGRLSETDHEHVLQQSEADLTTRRAVEYDPARGLLDRIGWCIAHRENAAKLAQHGKMDGVVRETLSRLTAIVSDPASAPVAHGHEEKLYRRIQLEEAEVFARMETAWDPVVIEPRKGARATGYLGLKLAFVPQPDTSHQTDWIRHPSADGKGPCGFVGDWLKEAETDGRGLMLFPVDPAERALRAAITDAGDLSQILRTLQSYAGNT